MPLCIVLLCAIMTERLHTIQAKVIGADKYLSFLRNLCARARARSISLYVYRIWYAYGRFVHSFGFLCARAIQRNKPAQVDTSKHIIGTQNIYGCLTSELYCVC